MKTRAVAFLCTLILCSFIGCGTGQEFSMGPTGVPNPAFIGEPPDEPYVFEGTPGTYGGMFVMSVESDPKSFNPLTATETSTTGIINGPVYTTLLGFDNISQALNNGLTTKYESTPDFLVWTFNIRRGVKWSDGQPFTAHDVKFNFDAAFDPNVANSIKDSFVQSDGTYPVVEAIDDYTVRMTLKEVNALFLDNVGSVYMCPRHKWEEAWKSGNFNTAIGIDTNPEEIVGLGPYRIKEFVPEQRVVLERNPYYWKVDTKGQRLPYIDRVVLLVVPDLNSTLLNFQNGKTDMMKQVRTEEVDLLKRAEATGDYTVYDLGAGFNTQYIIVNQHTGKNPSTGEPYVDPVKLAWFTNVKFRQALSYAIDREGIAKTAYQGLAQSIYSMCPPANKVWYDDAAVKKYPYDTEQAKALLKEIGIEDRNGDGIAEDSRGNKIQFNLITNSNNPTRINIATFIQSNLKAVGIDINFQAVPFNSMVEMMQTNHNFDAVIGGWQSGNPPDPVLMKSILISSGRLHYNYPAQETPATPWEARIDELMDLNQGTMDLAARKRYFSEVLTIWSENLPEIDLIAPNYFVAAKNRFGNLRPSPLPLYTYWNIEELYLTK